MTAAMPKAANWFREEYAAAKARNDAVPSRSRMTVTNPAFFARQEPSSSPGSQAAQTATTDGTNP